MVEVPRDGRGSRLRPTQRTNEESMMRIAAPGWRGSGATWRKYLQLAAASVIMTDGIVSAALGHRFIVCLQRHAPRPLQPLLSLFLRLPEPLFRAGATA